ncbi:MAG: hypothetical protein MUQ56_03825, partial [Thermoleophilia bacterium]|nr:hypothetical protein [Thermoleophilia bacterium]
MAVPGTTGEIGMTICPGKKGASPYGRPWDRDLGVDIEAVRAWRPDVVIILMEALPGGCVIRAPRALLEIAPARIAAEVRSMASEAGDVRRLHAKALLYEGDDSVAIMIGSSNLTAKGLGLAGRSHRE